MNGINIICFWHKGCKCKKNYQLNLHSEKCLKRTFLCESFLFGFCSNYCYHNYIEEQGYNLIDEKNSLFERLKNDDIPEDIMF